MAVLPLAIEAGFEGEVEEGTAALEGEMDELMEEGLLYRNGNFTEMNFTPRPVKDANGLSTFDTLEAATPLGGKAQVIDTSGLVNLKAVKIDPGHYGIVPRDPSRMGEWMSSRGTTFVHELTRELMGARTDQVNRPR